MDTVQLGFMQGYIRKEAGSATEALLQAMAPGIHLNRDEPARIHFKRNGLVVPREDLPGMTFGSDVGESAHPYNRDMAKLAETGEDKDNEEEGEEIPRDRKPAVPVRKQEQRQEQKEATLRLLSKTAKKKETKSDKKVEKVMGEFKRGELRSGSKEGPRVTDRRQAVAIAMSEADKVASEGIREKIQVLKKHFQKQAAFSALVRTRVSK